MIKKIVKVTDPTLRLKSKPVKKIDKKIRTLIKDLKDTLSSQKDPEGVGLAASQIGKNLRIFVTKYQDKIEVYINPKVLFVSKDKKKNGKGTKKIKRPKIMEGCLSLPNFYGPLARSGKLKISYKNVSGKNIIKTFEGFEAQIIQHEIDHLNGKLFIDHLIEQKKPLYELIDDSWEEVDLPY